MANTSIKKDRIRPYPHFKFPDEITIEIKKMTESECLWHCVHPLSYELTTTNYGWFPVDVLMGVVNRRYEDTNLIGANIGANLGTASIAVTNIKAAIKLLKNAGYKDIIIV